LVVTCTMATASQVHLSVSRCTEIADWVTILFYAFPRFDNNVAALKSRTRALKLLFWELFGVKLGHAGAGGVVGRDSGYCVITLPAA
jgi:hypothetical protein